MLCKKILITSKSIPAALPHITEAAAFLASRGIECYCPEVKASFLSAVPGVKPLSQDRYAEIDVVLSFGGDGTILKTARYFLEYGTPIIGVNMGTVGYLTDTEPKDVVPALTKFLNGDYKIEKRSTLKITCDGRSYVGVNEAVVYRGGMSHILTIDVAFDGQEIETVRSDGIIVSTPTGSTAYNLSAGGPIVAPLSKTMLITPICAHSLTARPIVIGDDSVIKLTARNYRTDKEKPSLDVDGRTVLRLPENTPIEVRAGDAYLTLVRIHPTSFYKALKGKLGTAGEGK